MTPGTPLNVDEIVAQGEVARVQGILEIGAVGDVQADHRRIARAPHSAVVSRDRQHAHPWDVAGKIVQDLIAVRCIERHFRIDTRGYAQQSARRIDDFTLGCDAATGKIDDLVAGERRAFDTSSFQAADAFDHERGDRQQGDDNQPGSDAENRLIAPLLRGRHLPQRLGRLCLNIRHSCDPRPRSWNLEDIRESLLRSSNKIERIGAILRMWKA